MLCFLGYLNAYAPQQKRLNARNSTEALRDYLENITPQPKAETGEQVVWVCRICGYVYEGDPIPEDFICPLCKHGVVDFERKGPKEEKTEEKKLKKYVCPVCFYSVEAEENPGKCIICGADMVEEKK